MFLRTDVGTDLAQPHVGEQTAAHADTPVDTPHRQLDALLVKGPLPGEYD